MAYYPAGVLGKMFSVLSAKRHTWMRKKQIDCGFIDGFGIG